MTEQDWLTVDIIESMIEQIEDHKDFNRKIRLFACACCRQVWHLLTDERSRNAVLIAEAYADGKATVEKLQKASLQAWAATALAVAIRTGSMTAEAARAAATVTTKTASEVATTRTAAFVALKAGKIIQADLFRDIFGNPFHPIILDPYWFTWNDRTIPRLAQAIYDDRAFDRLPILADALEEAGCTDAAILDHCRQSGVHARGCWLVDLLLGKS
jgi:hypothetical protein